MLVGLQGMALAVLGYLNGIGGALVEVAKKVVGL